MAIETLTMSRDELDNVVSLFEGESDVYVEETPDTLRCVLIVGGSAADKCFISASEGIAGIWWVEVLRGVLAA